MNINPQQFGAATEAIKNNTGMIKDLQTNVKEGFEKIHNKIDSHMQVEERERGKLNNRLGNIEDIFKFLKWIFPALMIVWPLLIPFLQKIIITSLFSNDLAIDLLSFFPWWNV